MYEQEWSGSPYLIIECILMAFFLLILWVWQRNRPVYLLDFHVYKPPDRFPPSCLENHYNEMFNIMYRDSDDACSPHIAVVYDRAANPEHMGYQGALCRASSHALTAVRFAVASAAKQRSWSKHTGTIRTQRILCSSWRRS